MPPIKNRVTGEVTTVSDEMAADLVRGGEFDLADGGMIETRAVTGGKVRVGGRQLRGDRSLAAVGVAEQAEALRQARRQRDYGDGVVNKLQAGAGGFAKGLSFGFVSPWEDEQDLNSTIAGVGEFAGILAPALLTAGGSVAATGAIRGGGTLARALALTPAGMVARGGARIAGATRAAGGVKAIAGVAAAGAFEGGVGNAGYYLSSVANGDQKLSAEGFVGSLAGGAMWGGAAGGAFGLAEKGLIRARSMFPRLAGGKATRKVAEAAEASFVTQTDDVMAAADEMMAAATTKLASLKVPKAQADLALAQALRAGDKGAADVARGALLDIKVQGAEARLTLASKGAPTPAAPVASPLSPTPAPSGASRSPAPTFDDVVEGTVYDLDPSVLRERGVVSLPAGYSRGRVDRIAGLRKAGKEIAPVKLAVRKDGSFEVVDGRHRILEAAEAGQSIRATIDRSSAAADDATRSIWAQADEAVPGPVLAEGSAPLSRDAERLGARMTELAESKADVASWLERVRGKADAGRWVKHTPEGGAWARGNADLHVDIVGKTPDEVLAWRRPHIDDISVREDYDEIIRRAAAQTDEAARDAMARQAAELEVQAMEAAPNALNAETMAARARLGTDPVDLAKRRIARDVEAISKMEADDVAYYVTGQRHPKAGQVKRYERTSRQGLARQPGDDAFAAAEAAMMRGGDGYAGVMDDATARVNRWRAEGKLQPGRLVDEAEQGIEVIGRMERANAELVAELGPAAPPAAKALADDYVRAVDDQARKGTERMAQVADDAAEAPIATVRRGKKAPTEAPAPVKEEGRMGMLGDLAGAAEWAQAAGVAGLPDVDKIPVIGPILSMYLKVRSARAMVGKLGGRVPATVEAKVASMAAAVRDRAAQAVDRMLGAGARVAAVASVSVPRTAALAHRLYDDGEARGKPANDGEAVAHRIAELSAAQANPDGVKRAVRRAMADAHDPDLVRAVEAAVLRKLQYLAGHMPKEPPPSLLGRKKWTPSKVEIDRFARRVKAAEDPASVFEDLADGTVTPEAADTLRSVYPELYAEAQMRLVERAGEVEAALPYQRVIRLSVLFDVPLLPSMRPERIAAYQTLGEPADPAMPDGAPPPTGMQNPPDLGSIYMPAADRRANRS